MTIISGINGCGKSTLARSTYELLFAAIKYDDLISKNIQRVLREMKQSLRSAITHLSGFIKRSDAIKLQQMAYRNYRDDNDEKYCDFIDTLINICTEISPPILSSKRKYYDSFCSILSNIIEKKYDINAKAEDLLEEFKNKYLKIISSADIYKSERKTNIFQHQWTELFGQKLNPSLFNVFENNIPIVDSDRNIVLLPDSVKRVFYIDTPMSLMNSSFFIFDETRKHWEDLNQVIWQSKKLGEPFDFKPTEAGGLLSGNFDWNEDKSTLLYQASNESPAFDVLKQGATGLKTFVIMQSLYREGLINKNTLLILDEPEAHLHPQWIVHYAKFLIMLRKETRCSFLISSHSTDMISALKFIAEKELDKKARFYLADIEDEKKLLYNFKGLDDDIEPIFEKFNKSFKIMDKYSDIEENIESSIS